MNDNDEALLTYWMDVLEEVVNGQLDGHTCPFCGFNPITVEVKGGQIHIKCTSCGQFFEGRVP